MLITLMQGYTPLYGYSLGLMSDLGPDNDNIKPKIVYIKNENDKVFYRVMKDGDIKDGEIDHKELPDHFPHDVISLEGARNFLDDILKVTSNRGHTPLYDTLFISRASCKII